MVTDGTRNKLIWNFEHRVRCKVFTAVSSCFVGLQNMRLCSLADPEDGDCKQRNLLHTRYKGPEVAMDRLQF
jgi:hypothetical protein